MSDIIAQFCTFSKAKINFIRAVSIKYAEERDARKADGMFSWLKDFLKPGNRLSFLSIKSQRITLTLPNDQIKLLVGYPQIHLSYLNR